MLLLPLAVLLELLEDLDNELFLEDLVEKTEDLAGLSSDSSRTGDAGPKEDDLTFFFLVLLLDDDSTGELGVERGVLVVSGMANAAAVPLSTNETLALPLVVDSGVDGAEAGSKWTW